MQPTNDTDYKALFSQLIKKQMLVLGPDITLAKVKNVMGLSVDVNGDVLKMDGDPQQMLQALINQFVELSGMIVKKTMESILTSYPGMMAMATSSAFGGGAQASSQTPQPVVQAATNTPVPTDTAVTSSPAVSQQDTSKDEVAPTQPHTEPPPMDSMNLDSLKTTPAASPQHHEEPQPFSSKDMQELNKALEQLSKSPLSTESASTAQPSPGQ